jgi:uncharacterized protein
MWLVELNPERLAARPAHRASLTELHKRGLVLAAGPLADDSGAVIVFDVPDRAALDDLLAADPYFATAGVTVRSVREWLTFLS